DGALSRFIERRGEGLHHICFQVHDVDSEHQRLKDEGYSFTSDSPRPGAHNGRVIFVHPKSFGGVLLELRSE
ncbi:MAG: VOC family protein, partial [Bdellovibrionales bacterium]|nr:VOC family protein [Bdellovibrionales bacterium]